MKTRPTTPHGRPVFPAISGERFLSGRIAIEEVGPTTYRRESGGRAPFSEDVEVLPQFLRIEERRTVSVARIAETSLIIASCLPAALHRRSSALVRSVWSSYLPRDADLHILSMATSGRADRDYTRAQDSDLPRRAAGSQHGVVESRFAQLRTTDIRHGPAI